MPRAMDAKDDRAGAALTDAAWSDVLIAVDRTYAELIEHQERLEAQNRELEALRQFLSSVITSVSDVLIVLDRDGRVDEVNASTCVCTGLPVAAWSAGAWRIWCAKRIARVFRP